MNKLFGGTYETADETILISGERIVVPDAEALFQGDYARQGPDLVIEGLDGAVFRIVGFFTAEAAPNLYSEQGAVITGDVAARLAGAQNPMAFAQAGPPAGVTPIGQIETLEGEAFATRAGGQRVGLQIGDPVYEDDLIETGGGSALGITFIDETVFSLSADARMILDELVYDPNGSDNSMVMNLVQGTFVFVTGQVAPTGDMRVETPVATMGIRGTTPMVVIEGQNGSTEFSILRDPDGKIGSYTLYDKVSGTSIERVVSESTIIQLTQAGGTPVPITVDATRLAERAEAQDNAYFAYTASRARIDRERQNNDSNQQDDNSDDRSDADDGTVTTGSIPGGPGSGGLKGFNVSLGDEGGEGETEGDGTTGDGTTQTGSGQSGSGSDAANNLAPKTFEATFQFLEDVGIVQGPLAASDDQGLANLTFEITQQPAFGFVFSNGDGTFTYISDPIFNTLQEGEITEVTFTYRATDSVGAVSNTSEVTFRVVGTNDVPTITVVDVEGTVSDVDEDASTPPSANAGDLTTTGSITFFDVDFLDRPMATEATKSITATAQGGGPLTLTAAQRAAIENAFSILNLPGNTSTGTVNWAYTIPESAIDFLGAGEVVTAVFTITLDDGFGGIVTQDVTITVNGAGSPNDAPVITAVDVEGAVADVPEAAGVPPSANAGPLMENGSVTFSDVDLTDRPVASEATKSVTGVAQGGGSLILTQAQQNAIEAAFSIISAQGNTNSGTVTWTYAIDESDVDFLAAGETVTAVFTITVTDDEGATDTQDVTITITGANDAPVINAIAQTNLTETTDTSDITGTANVTFGDVDLNDVGHTAQITGVTTSGEVDGLTGLTPAQLQSFVTLSQITKVAGSDQGSLTATFAAASGVFDYLATGQTVQLTYTLLVDDGDGNGTDTKTFTVEITGTNDVPAINAIAQTNLTETTDTSDVTGTINITFGDVDLDDVGHTAQITGVTTSGQDAGLAGFSPSQLQSFVSLSQVTKAAGSDQGSLTATFSAGSDVFDYLNAGETVQLTYTLQADDGDGGIDSQTFTVQVTGTNDAPTLDLDGSAAGSGYMTQFIAGSGPVAIADIDASITDVDAGATIASATITLTNNPDGAAEQLVVIGTLPGGITAGQYNSSTGELTLSGPASLATFQSALSQIGYDNAEPQPDPADRVITVTVNDGTADSAPAETTVTICPGNDPIVLDLDGDGLAFTRASAGTTFDLDNDGSAEGLGWVSATDGLLVSDLDGSGKIENGSEVFSPWYGEGGFADALAALATLDVNGDGVIDANDEGFENIQVWLDADTDAETDDGELKSLAEHGIDSIDLAARRVDTQIDGQTIFAEGSFTMSDGTTRAYAGVAFEAADPLEEAIVALADAGPAPQGAPAGQLASVSGATLDLLADALAGDTGRRGSGYNLDSLFGGDGAVPVTDGANPTAATARDGIFAGDDSPAASTGGAGAGAGFAASDMMIDDMAAAV